MNEFNYLNGKRLLIVDDEPDVLDTLEEVLPMCVITKATTFDTAVAYLQDQYFDMVILDIMGVNGFELLEIATAKNFPAVMLTAHALSPENVKKSYKKGAASYFPKEEMADIAYFLDDILGAVEKGKNTWGRWYDRLSSFFEKRFGPDWKEQDKEFWEKFPFY
jgi:DNA-binding NtrC family response regulator